MAGDPVLGCQAASSSPHRRDRPGKELLLMSVGRCKPDQNRTPLDWRSQSRRHRRPAAPTPSAPRSGAARTGGPSRPRAVASRPARRGRSGHRPPPHDRDQPHRRAEDEMHRAVEEVARGREGHDRQRDDLGGAYGRQHWRAQVQQDRDEQNDPAGARERGTETDERADDEQGGRPEAGCLPDWTPQQGVGASEHHQRGEGCCHQSRPSACQTPKLKAPLAAAARKARIVLPLPSTATLPGFHPHFCQPYLGSCGSGRTRSWLWS